MRKDVLRRSLTALAIAPLMISIAACSDEEIRTAIITRCPELATYTAEQQQRAAAELRALPRESVIALMTADYGTLRARCRAYLRQAS